MQGIHSLPPLANGKAKARPPRLAAANQDGIPSVWFRSPLESLISSPPSRKSTGKSRDGPRSARSVTRPFSIIVPRRRQPSSVTGRSMRLNGSAPRGGSRFRRAMLTNGRVSSASRRGRTSRYQRTIQRPLGGGVQGRATWSFTGLSTEMVFMVPAARAGAQPNGHGDDSIPGKRVGRAERGREQKAGRQKFGSPQSALF